MEIKKIPQRCSSVNTDSYDKYMESSLSHEECTVKNKKARERSQIVNGREKGSW